MKNSIDYKIIEEFAKKDQESRLFTYVNMSVPTEERQKALQHYYEVKKAYHKPSIIYFQ
jgi:hypothetical protein